MTIAASAMLGACGGAQTAEGENITLRNLVDSDVAGDPRPGYVLEGELVPTPSDRQSRYYLLRSRQTPTGTRIAILRQEKGERIAYSRNEIDCGRRLFHVLGVGDTRGGAEADIVYDGPLRSVAGLPLREELADYICEKAGTPLATG
jgi:hypothetical protein